jgi:diguanylate cyclase (GGDEF)-like protein
VRKELRGYDILGRYGGDEFIVLFPQTDLDEAMEVAARTESAIKAVNMPDLPGVNISFSGGVAARSPEAEDLESMIKMADQALYQAKTSGRACVTCL